MRERGAVERAHAGVSLEVVARVGGGDRRGDGDSDRSSDLLVRVQQSGGHAGVIRSNAGERSDRHRHECEGEPDAAEDEGREQVGEVRPVYRQLRVQHEAGGREGHAHRQHEADADAGDECLRDGGEADDRER